MNEFDVVVVGAGPAGCAVVNSLVGYKILLVDRAKLPRDKPCGGILIEKSAEIIKRYDIKSQIVRYPKITRIEYVDWDNNLIVEQKKNWWNIERKSLDSFLFSLCKDKVVLFQETKFLDFKEKKNRIEVLVERGSKRYIIKTKYLVSAEGALSRVRRRFSSKVIPYYYAVQEKLKTKITPNKTYFIYDNDITDYYSWVIPKGQFTVVGSAIKRGDDVEEKIELMKTKTRINLGISGKVAQREGAVGLKPGRLDDITLGRGNILLVGEAAGLISPSSGEGISYALRSGELCGKAISDSPENVLEEYKKLCKPIISEMSKKIEKSTLLADPKKRIELFKTLKGGK